MNWPNSGPNKVRGGWGGWGPYNDARNGPFLAASTVRNTASRDRGRLPTIPQNVRKIKGNPFVSENESSWYLIANKNWPNFWPNRARGGSNKTIPKMGNSQP